MSYSSNILYYIFLNFKVKKFKMNKYLTLCVFLSLTYSISSKLPRKKIIFIRDVFQDTKYDLDEIKLSYENNIYYGNIVKGVLIATSISTSVSIS